jgi:hypothetical protein
LKAFSSKNLLTQVKSKEVNNMDDEPTTDAPAEGGGEAPAERLGIGPLGPLPGVFVYKKLIYSTLLDLST